MVSALPTPIPALRSYATLLLQLDGLMARGEGNAAAADAIREQMEEPWYSMTAAEQERAGGLSEDLYALTQGGPKAVAMSAEDRLRWANEARAALRDSADPDLALAFLRRPIPEGTSPYFIPFLQSRCWERLGAFDVALRFMREAERLDPRHAVFVMMLLDKLGQTDEAEACAGRIRENEEARMLAALS